MLALFLLSVFMLTGAGKLNNGGGGTQGQREEAVSGSLTDFENENSEGPDVWRTDQQRSLT